jgi:hypothetical protein
MPDWREEYAPEYDSPFGPPDNEHPIAKLYRVEWEAEKRALAKINGFLATLKPDDAQVQLFTFEERRQWGLRVNARRSVRE